VLILAAFPTPTPIFAEVALQQTTFHQSLRRRPSSLPVNDHSFQPIPNSSQTARHTAGLTLLCHSNNLIFVNHHFIVVVSTIPLVHTSVDPTISKLKIQALLPEQCSPESIDDNTNRVHHGSSTTKIFFASASSITISINVPRCVVTIAGQS